MRAVVIVPVVKAARGKPDPAAPAPRSDEARLEEAVGLLTDR